MSAYVYRSDQELPAIPLEWRDGVTNVLRDFSTGWTFTVKIALATAPTAVLLTKTAGVTGAATSPNITIDWSTTDWSGLTAGLDYVVHVYARRTSDTKDDVFRPDKPITLTLLAAPV